ncbi:hypothetical protein FOZ63_025975, partial [Perkinsus olseni]
LRVPLQSAADVPAKQRLAVLNQHKRATEVNLLLSIVLHSGDHLGTERFLSRVAFGTASFESI